MRIDQPYEGKKDWENRRILRLIRLVWQTDNAVARSSSNRFRCYRVDPIIVEEAELVTVQGERIQNSRNYNQKDCRKPTQMLSFVRSLHSISALLVWNLKL